MGSCPLYQSRALRILVSLLLLAAFRLATLQVSGLTATYARYAHLTGDVVLVAIGALMWLRPEWLMFG